jgi:ribosomal protein S1
MYASPRRVSKRDVEFGVRLSREIPGRRQIRREEEDQHQAKAFERFIRIHQEGDVVSATVIGSKPKGGKVLLDGGVKADIDDSLDHEPGAKVRWIETPDVRQRIQVYVRRIYLKRHYIAVSIHTFTQDPKFNLFNAGYRSSFDGNQATFAVLPWEKPWLARNARRR